MDLELLFLYVSTKGAKVQEGKREKMRFEFWNVGVVMWYVENMSSALLYVASMYLMIHKMGYVMAIEKQNCSLCKYILK